ncbi:hypothetical protein F5Y19DRAFT_438616 [Xylariaceae sp. FL1651]|nr:hypothetical protein F5Y19DRAFT_438616 [Xylariaceae sp. FL1651]
MSMTVADHVTSCYRLFADILKAATDSQPPIPELATKIENESDRFNVYVRNVGAHHRIGKRSLDYRLRDASPIRRQVTTLLEELCGLLRDVLHVLQGGSLDDNGMGEVPQPNDMSFLEEVEEILSITHNIISCLIRLWMSIQTPFSRDRFTSFPGTDTSHFEPHDTKHVESKYPMISQDLAQHLGKGISYRRQYFKYREARHAILASEPGAGADGSSTVISSIPEGLKDHIRATETIDTGSGDGESCSGFTQTSFATSRADFERPRVPPIPYIPEDGLFECPFCYMFISADTRQSWKRHVFSDLRPYICLHSDCLSHTQNFSRRRDWAQHLQHKNWRIWHCPFECSESFESASSLRTHITVSHSDRGVEHQPDQVLLELASRPRPLWQFDVCPFYFEDIDNANKYILHVGRHQEDLSLFALPSCEYETSEQEERYRLRSGVSSDGSEDDVSETEKYVINKPSQEASNQDTPKPGWVYSNISSYCLGLPELNRFLHMIFGDSNYTTGQRLLRIFDTAQFNERRTRYSRAY